MTQTNIVEIPKTYGDLINVALYQLTITQTNIIVLPNKINNLINLDLLFL